MRTYIAERKWRGYRESRASRARQGYPSCYDSLLKTAKAGRLPQARRLLRETEIRCWKPEHQEDLFAEATGQPNPRLLNLLLAAGLGKGLRWKKEARWLWRAVYKNCFAVARILLRKGADPNGDNAEDYVPLTTAAYYGRTTLVTLLLHYGANPDRIASLTGRTPLLEAAKDGNLATLQLLIRSGADPNISGNQEVTPLMEAVSSRTQALEKVETLLAAGADPNVMDEQGGTPLLRALQNQQGEIAEILLRAGADVNLGASWKPLLAAVRSGMTEQVAALLDQEADCQFRDDGGWNALRWAAEISHNEVIPLLLERDKDLPALHRAVLSGQMEVIENLLLSGVNLDEQAEGGLTALAWAALTAQGPLARILLGAGADPNLSDTGGTTPLINAARRADETTIRALLAHRADVLMRRRDGWTALMVAASHGGSLPIVMALLEAGADVEAKGRRGVNALTLASYYGHTEIVRALLDSGAEVNAREEEGNTALMRAAEHGYHDILHLLLSRGADLNLQTKDGYTTLRYADWWCEEKGTEKLLRKAGAR